MSTKICKKNSGDWIKKNEEIGIIYYYFQILNEDLLQKDIQDIIEIRIDSSAPAHDHSSNIESTPLLLDVTLCTSTTKINENIADVNKMQQLTTIENPVKNSCMLTRNIEEQLLIIYQN